MNFRRNWIKSRRQSSLRERLVRRAGMEQLDPRLLLAGVSVNVSGDTEYVVDGTADTLSIYNNGSFVSSQSLGGVLTLNVSGPTGGFASLGVNAPSGGGTAFSISNGSVVLGSLTIDFDSTIDTVALVGSNNADPTENALT